MNTTDDRIAQFQNMAVADPTNDMAHFSLGSAYLQAGRPAEAAGSLERCIELNPQMSKAYELCGQAMVAAGWEDKAASMLARGYEIAASQGDRMPQDSMGALLDGLGRPRPSISDAPVAPASTGTALDGPPFRGPVGEWIGANITAEKWGAWIDQGTKIINELRLDLSRPEDSAMFDQHMHEFLGVPAELH
jgi:Fe-S cluster biosynthesis and repair protein YggX